MNADERWKLAILELDDYTCQRCGANTCLDAAHIQSRATDPELRHDPTNGITLCRSCHELFHDNPVRFRNFIAVWRETLYDTATYRLL